MSIMAIDYLANSTLLINLINHNYMEYASDKEERKLQIIIQIWIDILYEHILK
jgi:hypothetical protein